ncbi:MAG TPA: sulfatase-like hydrolase/transferase [Planctomycetota bacterium]|nr:sulfatase-like hydrolase/transferase [Planctomycetota bacterium]
MVMILKSAILLLALGVPGPASPNRAEKPNLIVILSDDVGMGDIACYGGKYPTPRIDALAKGGTRFEYCYATPLCGPSRSVLLTGRYPFRTGLINNQSAAAIQPDKEIMLPTILKKAGYVTCSVGKWGQMSHGPVEWGFDESLVFKGSGRYWRDQTQTYHVNGQEKNLAEGVYLPDLMHDFAADFISRHKDQPFCLYYPMSHIHGPIVKTPDSKGDATLYADNIAYMDKLVGKLVDELERQGLREKTLVLFTGDNGTARNGARSPVDGMPLSGQKATMLEGGSRVPLIANWPGTTPAGALNHDLTDFSDFLVTFAELGGATLPEGRKIDGRSFAAQIRGEKGTPREWVYVELDGKSYVRDGRYKLTNGGELFDMKEAPFKEILVPKDATDEAAPDARKRLQAVLDEHPAAPGSPRKKKKN